jgi:N-formylglutamate deformylase
MYPGASNTELCPTRFFTGDPLYRPGYEPSPEEKAKRRKTYWDPYHNALKEDIQRLKAIHGFVLLWDAHSIRSQIPWLFEGILPGLNIGTADGTSADSTITMAVSEVAASHAGATFAINGRFKGGYITRHYGNPAADVHAVQLEMCQSLYMGEEPPFEYSPFLAASIQPVLEKMVSSALSSCKALYAR